MTHRTDLIQTVTRVFWHTDHHEWDRLATVFAPQVRLDYTALVGGEPAEATPRDIIDAWQPGFEAIDAHQHLVANHLVEIHDDRGVLTAAFQATHQYAGQFWVLGGDYHFELSLQGEEWLVSAMTMTPTWQTGNSDLLAQAMQAAASR